MARQYTAWVIQNGRGKSAMFLSNFLTFYSGEANVTQWSEVPAKALQFVRRSDARRLIDGCDIGGARPVEKQFG